MSRLYFVVCEDCLVKSEAVGKNTEEYGFWGDPKTFSKFLFDHENHTLRYVDEHSALWERTLNYYPSSPPCETGTDHPFNPQHIGCPGCRPVVRG
jgi:hypothetical protein